ncbi:MAG: hypothetical protein AB3N16_05095 [Flavobacteriaceae bacterium]
MKKKSLCWILGPLAFLFLGCTAQKKPYEREYAKAWKEIIKSEAWANSLRGEAASDHFLVSSDKDVYLNDTPPTPSVVLNDEKYHHLVTRAYVKIVAEAEKADMRLKAEYDKWNNTSLERPGQEYELKREHARVNKRYRAHKAMLEGLKSWNIFSKYGTDDLEFFKKENSTHVNNMAQNGQSEEAIVNFLIYQLADLYHFE